MTYLPLLLFIFILGYLTLSYFLMNSNLPKLKWLKISAAYPVGLGVCSIILYGCYIVSPQNAKLLCILIPHLWIGLLILIGIQNRSGKGTGHLSLFTTKDLKSVLSQKLRQAISKENFLKNKFVFIMTVISLCLFIYSLIIFINMSLRAIVPIIHGGWDARFIWHVKAKFLFRDVLLWKNLYSPLISWTHPDYPLLLPGAIAWGWNWLGQELFAWPGALSMTFLACMVIALLWHFSAIGALWAGLMAACVLINNHYLLFWTYEQYADIPLALFILLATVFALQTLRHKSFHAAALTGLFCGYSLWTKLEGLFFTTFMFSLLLVYLWRDSSIDKKMKIKYLLCFIAAAAIPVAAFLFQKLLFAPSGDYWGSGRSLQDYSQAIFNFHRIRVVIMVFLMYLFRAPSWNGFWIFFVIAIVYRRFFLKQDSPLKFGWFPLILTLLMCVGYGFVLLISPFNLMMQIDTALQRLILHASMPAIIFMFESLRPSVEIKR